VNLVSFLFGFSGRINRTQYWLGCMCAGVGGAVLFFMLALLTMPNIGAPKTSADAIQILPSMALTFGIPLILMGWVGSALQTKRFHDRGRGGLWALLPFLPMTMIVTTVVSGAATGASLDQVMSSAAMWLLLLQLVNLFMFVDLGCMPGKPGPNRFGNPPGGGLGAGAPINSPSPQSAQAKATPSIPGMASAQPTPGATSTWTGAESAIERAIAAQGKPAPAPALKAPAARSGLQPAASLRLATSSTFGRKVTQ